MVDSAQADAFFCFGLQTFPLVGFLVSVHPLEGRSRGNPDYDTLIDLATHPFPKIV
jgi:hypothetical protein